MTGLFDRSAGRMILNAAVSFAAGLMASRASILGGLSPFGIAAVACASKGGSIFALLGAVFGYLLPGGSQYAARYIAATAAAFIFKWLFSGFEEIARHPAFTPSISGCACLLTGIAVVFTDGATAYGMVLCAAEALICACAAAFFTRAFPLLRRPSRLWSAERNELACAVIACCVFLLAFSHISVSGISLGRILGVLLLLAAAFYGGEAGGSMTGAALGLVMGLGDKSMACVLAGYAFGGLIAGFFAPLGRFGCTVAFLLANAVACINLGSSQQVIVGLYEVVAATVIFMLLPEKLLCRLSAVFAPARQSAKVLPGAGGAASRLLAAAQALREVSKTVSNVGDRLESLAGNDISSVYTGAGDIVCAKCGMKMYCWGTAYNDTMDSLNTMTPALRKNRRLTREDVPHHFAGRCCRLGELLECVNRRFAEFTAERRAGRSVAQMRGLLSEQLEGLASFLGDLGKDASGAQRVRLPGDAVRSALSSCGLAALETECSLDERGCMAVEAVVERGVKAAVNRDMLLSGLKGACGRTFDGPFLASTEKMMTLTFRQKPGLSAAFGKSQICKTGERLCGDASDCYVDESGKAVMMVSDGMGCGGAAAVDSNLAVGIMTRLLRSGFGFDAAMSVVGSAMMLKSGEESFATLDIVCIDLFTGQTDFFKAGAPPTYIRRCGRAERIHQSSMPVGILRGARLERSGTHLRRGDLVVMVSDGVVSGSDDWLIREIEGFAESNAADFAEHLAAEAKRLRADGHDDDITALVALIE